MCVSENEQFHILLCLLRIIEADQEDMNILTSLASDRGARSIRDAQQPVNVDNELRSMRLLLSLVQSYLRVYPTTFEDDCQRLSNGML